MILSELEQALDELLRQGPHESYRPQLDEWGEGRDDGISPVRLTVEMDLVRVAAYDFQCNRISVSPSWSRRDAPSSLSPLWSL